MKNMIMSLAAMKESAARVGSHYFEPDTIKFWGAKVHDTANRYGLFVESIDDFSRTKKLYCVKMWLDGYAYTVEPHEIGETYEHFATLKGARKFRDKLTKALDSAAECYRENAVISDICEIYENGCNSGVYTLKNSAGDTIEINTNNFDRFICG